MPVVQQDSRVVPPLPEPRTITLEVVAASEITANMRRIVLGGEELRGFHHLPGQDIMLSLPTGTGGAVNRRYSIRHFEPSSLTLELNAVRHGSGPGSRWLELAAAGQLLANVVAPRGKITVNPAAPWHLFIGDETAIPAAYNMVEAIGTTAGAKLLMEVAGADEEMTPAPAPATWIHRQGDPPGEEGRLMEAVAGLALPPGDGHVYIAGEARTVLRIRDLLVGRGVVRARMSVKAYWRKDMANLERGEPQPAE